MKQITLTITLAIVVTLTIYSQPPQAFKYQAVVRDNSGEIIQNQAVGLRISIHEGSPSGEVSYQETFSETTNQFGIVNLEIGNGVPVYSTFSSIDWSTDSKFIEIEIDPAGGTSYVSMGTSEILSVPYALYSASSADSSKWKQNGNKVYYNDGFVGIGTDTPGGLLDVRGMNTDDGVVFNLGNSDLSHKLTFFGGKETDPNPFIQWKSGDPLRFSTDEGGWLERMRITSEGKVGIGTSLPIYHLDVSDTATNGYVEIGVSAKDANGAFAAYSSTLPFPFDHFADRVSLLSNAFTSSGLDIRADGEYSNIRFYTGGVLPENQRMLIGSNGRVGIGTTDLSWGQVTILGTSGIYGLYIKDAGYQGIYVNNSGNSGIHVNTSLSNGIVVWNSGYDGVSITNSGDDGVSVDDSGDDGVYVYDSGSDWGFFAHNDKTYSFGGYYPAKSGSFAINTSTGTLEPGDLVCISGGYKSNTLGEESPLVMNVSKANGKNPQSIFGVVESKVYIHERTKEMGEGEPTAQKSFRFKEGNIGQGDYLAVVVFGMADVKVNPHEPISSGEAIVAGSSVARKARTTEINGITFTENTGIIGKALEDSNGKEKIKVFVNCK